LTFSENLEAWAIWPFLNYELFIVPNKPDFNEFMRFIIFYVFSEILDEINVNLSKSLRKSVSLHALKGFGLKPNVFKGGSFYRKRAQSLDISIICSIFGFFHDFAGTSPTNIEYPFIREASICLPEFRF